MRKAICIVALASAVSWSADWSDLDFVLASSFPRELGEYLRASEGHDAYTLAAWLNPFYLQSDFNGDGRIDIAVLVQEKATAKRGVLIFHVGANQHFVVGAGNAIGNGGDDFNWMDAWHVHPKGSVGRSAHAEGDPPLLLGDALMVIKTEAASGLVYWTGTQYSWYQQGD